MSVESEDVIALYERHADAWVRACLQESTLYEKPWLDRFCKLLTTAGSVLDFGCGLAHLKPFLDQKFPSVTYTGVDIVPEFIAHNAHKYPDSTFKLISSVEDIDGCFDHTAISGTFNIKYDESGTKNWDIISSILLSLFNKTHISLSADFFTDDVDYMQQDSYHQNPDKLYRFIRKHISKYMVMDSSYLPFEYAVTILKNIQE